MPGDTKNMAEYADLSTRGGGYLANFLRSDIFQIFNIVKTHVSYWISHLHLTGIATAQLQWHMSNMNVI